MVKLLIQKRVINDIKLKHQLIFEIKFFYISPQYTYIILLSPHNV